MKRTLHPKYASVLEKITRVGHPDLESIARCFGLLSATAAINGACDRRLGAMGLSEGRFVLLLLLHEEREGLFPHELARRAGVTRATITGLLDNLERDGIVARQACSSDRRKLRVSLTEAGRDMAARLYRSHTDWVASLFSDVTAEEARVLDGLFERLSRRLEADAKREEM